MNARTSRFLTILVCATTILNAACSTTTQRFTPTQAGLDHRGISAGDTVLIRYANITDRRSSSRSEHVHIVAVDDVGISGTGTNGAPVIVNYEDIFAIEIDKVGLISTDSPAHAGAGKVLEVMVDTVALAACIAIGAYGVACP